MDGPWWSEAGVAPILVRPFAMTAIPHPESTASKLSIEGEVARPQALDRRQLAALDPMAQVADVGTLVPGKQGRAVRLSAIAKSAGLRASARHVHIGSADPKFAVSVPLTEVLDTALVVFELAGAPVPSEKGGPFRLLVPGHSDECVNVKQLASLTFAAAPGRDTRPKDDAEHALMHARGCSPKPTDPNNSATKRT